MDTRLYIGLHASKHIELAIANYVKLSVIKKKLVSIDKLTEYIFLIT